MEIRRATSADAEACFSVQKRSAVVGSAHIFPQDEYPFPDELVRAEWRARLGSEGWVAMAIVAGEPVGTVSARGERMESLFVTPEQWGTGVADRLHDAALAHIAAAGRRMAGMASRRTRSWWATGVSSQPCQDRCRELRPRSRRT